MHLALGYNESAVRLAKTFTLGARTCKWTTPQRTASLYLSVVAIRGRLAAETLLKRRAGEGAASKHADASD